MNTSDILKRNIPEFQQNSEALDGYLEAAGEFFDGTKEAIKNLDNVHDHKNSTGFFYENTLKERGMDVPSRLTEETKRALLRDIAEIHRKNGTLDGIIHAVRMAGLTPEIRVGWLPSPKEVRKGYLRDPVTLEAKPYDITRYIYTDMLYGEPEATEDGVFFYGYRYKDSLQEERIGPLPILGERYDNPPLNPVPVEKTPYVIVRYEDNGSFVVTDTVVDPETGEVFEYSTSEEFQLVNEVLRYFLVENNRPTTVRIIIIVAMQPLEEILEVSDEYADAAVYQDDGGDMIADSVVAQDTFSPSGTMTVSAPVIGGLWIVGDASPILYRLSCVALKVGPFTSVKEVYEFETRTVTISQLPTNPPIRIPLRYNTDISFVAPRSCGMNVVAYEEDGGLPIVLDVVGFSDTYFRRIPLEYRYVEIQFDGVSSDEFNATVTYHGIPSSEGIDFTDEFGSSVTDEEGDPLSDES